MSLTEDRVLIAYEINPSAGTIGILWHDRILRDGVPISNPTLHRAAYSLDAGEIPQHIRDEFNISVAQILDESLLTMAESVEYLRGQLRDKTEKLQNCAVEINSLRQLLIDAQARLEELEMEGGGAGRI